MASRSSFVWTLHYSGGQLNLLKPPSHVPQQILPLFPGFPRNPQSFHILLVYQLKFKFLIPLNS